MSDFYDEEPQGPMHDSGITVNAEIQIGWDRGEIIQGVINQVAERIYQDIKPEVVDAVKATLDDMANKALAETFDAVIQPTGKWGKAEGEPISIRDLLQRDAETWLMQNVDSEGRGGSNAYGDKHHRIHWLFERALRGTSDRRGKTKLQKMVIEAVKETVGDVNEIVNRIVREKVKEVLKV